jgi:spore coat protein U-like protein
MSIKFASSACALCILASGLVSRPILAATPTASFGVTATVQVGCLFSATSIPLGDYPAAVANAASNVLVTCTNATPYIVDLQPELASGTTVLTRRLTGPVSVLPGYAPLPNFTRLVNWNGNGSSQTLSPPSQILTRRYVRASNYADTIIITVTY